MNRFTDTLVVSPLADGHNWVIRQDPDWPGRRFGYDDVATGYEIDVPLHFTTDFASVPRPLWWIFPPWGKYGNAAVLHDCLYWYQVMPRAECDRVFLRAMLSSGTGKKVARTLFLAVRLFGWLAWDTNRSNRWRHGVGYKISKRFGKGHGFKCTR